ncbi:hypothetical protein DRE_01437 [Drechslerella stenobrocha 248]|uniref:A-kinase anchor protein 7-like phosphoesterase domain-containing protein n=1 Tax=Drechslerella stenobrocha 248 TaxID=1043628 RepID=W7I4A5_9PEZI|nr:hypothetical protein DRE_01437 [Drechslerella stenobrocha 248]
MSANAGASNAGRNPQGPGQSRERLTHFLAIPLHGQHFTPLPPAYASFKSAVAQFAIDETPPPDADADADTRIPPGAIRDFNTLHLTLGVMSLPTTEQLQTALSTLESLDLRRFLPAAADATTTDPRLYIDLKGVAAMSSAPSRIQKCGVLMIPPVDSADATSERLYPFARAVRDHFVEAGVMQLEARPLKLHATIVNTVYCKPGKGARDSKRKGGKVRRDDLQFDATDVLERYRETVFAERLEVDRVQICKMGAKKGVEVVGEDGGVDIVGGGYEVVGSRLIWPP